MSILCENLLERVQEDLFRFKTNNRNRKGLQKIRGQVQRPFGVAPGNKCIACVMLKQNEEHLLSVLEEVLEEADLRDRYTQVGGLCLSHLQAGLVQWKSTSAREFARHTAVNTVEKLLSDLGEFQRKHDYQYKNEPRGAEWSSPERAIEFLAGRRTEPPALLKLAPSRQGKSF